MNGDERIGLSVFAEQAAQEWLCRRPDVPEPKFTFFPGGRAMNPAHRFLDMLQQAGDLAKQNRTSWCQAHMVTRAFENIRAKCLFQLLDSAAERRLRNAQALSRARVAQFLSNCLKISQMS